MVLTEKQVEQMRKQGLSDVRIAELAKAKGYEMPQKKDLLQKATDISGKLFAGGKVGEAIGTLGGYAYTAAKEKLGMVPKGTTEQYDLSAPSPLQVAGDIAKGAIQVAGAKMPIAGSVVGKIAQFGALGFGSGIASGVADGKGAEEIARDAISEGFKGALTGFTFGVAEKALTGATNVLNKTGKKIQYSVVKPSAKDVNDGFDVATIQKYDLGGSLKDTFKKTNEKISSLSKELYEKLGTNKSPIDLNDVFEQTVRDLAKDKNINFGSNKPLETALTNLQEEIAQVAGKNGLVSILDGQEIKQASGLKGAWLDGVADETARASEKAYTTFYRNIKTAIENGSPEGVREINAQIGELIPVLRAVIRRIPVAERNMPIPLSDLITISTSIVEPRALAMPVLSILSKSGKVGNALSNLQGLGQGAVQKAEQVAQSMIAR